MTTLEYRIRWLVFLMLAVSYLYFLPRWADWSQNSRLDLTLAIVDQGTLSIDDYYTNTGDYALFEGRHYLDKAPGPSLLAVPVYFLIRPLLQWEPVQSLMMRLGSNEAFAQTLMESGTGVLADKVYFMVVLYVVNIAVVALPAASLGLLIFSFLRAVGVSLGWSLATTLIYGLATNAFPYSWVFFSHQTVAFLLFAAFHLVFRIKHGQMSSWWLALAGFMLGWAVISEYPSALIAGGIFCYALTLRKIKPITSMITGGAIPGLILVIYNLLIFRTPLPVGYQYSELYTDIHSVGLFSITYPQPEALWGITFGTFRGLFFLSPVLLLAVAGFIPWFQQKQWRGEWWVSIWAVISFFLFNSSSIMWQGGYSVGPRYLVPMLPFLALGLGQMLNRFGKKPWLKVSLIILTLWSVFAIWTETIGGQFFPDWTTDPLWNFSLPRLLQGDIARNLGMVLGLKGWFSLIPLGLILGILGFLTVNELRKAPNEETNADIRAQ